MNEWTMWKKAHDDDNGPRFVRTQSCFIPTQQQQSAAARHKINALPNGSSVVRKTKLIVEQSNMIENIHIPNAK